VIYGACRGRMTEIVRGLDDRRLATPVPATGAWTVHDVVAHLVGVVTDINAARFDGLGSEEANAVQVADRRDRSVAELIDEWEAGAAQFEATLTAIGGVRAELGIADIWNHEQDVRGALGIPGGRDPEAEHAAISGYCGVRVAQVAQAGVAPLRLRAGVDEWRCGEGELGATVIAEPYELARLICGRRTAEQIRGYLWDGDPEPYVSLLVAPNLVEPLAN
jgi:uncharacterized protein (TIGR03083 family)